MSERDALYLTALLQNLGVFVGRAGLPESEIRLGRFRTPDAPSPDGSLTAALVARYAGAQAAPDPESTLTQLIRIAEACATPEPGPAPHPPGEDASRMRLESAVNRITLERAGASLRLAEPRHLGFGPLSIERDALFPVDDGPAFPGSPYPRAVRSLLDELEAVQDEAGVFALLEKYLYAAPLGAGAPDVSLFDHARVTAAVALCLYDEYTSGSWRGEEARIAGGDDDAELPPPCLLVRGEVSGIQDFIFDVPSRRISKSLKGRSYFVQLAADACVRHLLDALRLKDASLLYSGGGTFFLLVPRCREERLAEARRAVVEALLPESVYVALGWAEVGVADFRAGRFAGRWKAVHDEIDRRKARRFQELGAGIFEPLPQERDVDRQHDTFAELTERLSRGTCYEYLPHGLAAVVEEEGRFQVRLGYDVRFRQEERNLRATVFNDTEFAGRFRSFRFAVKDLPRFDEPLIGWLYPDPSNPPPPEVVPDKLIDFNHLAELARGRTGTPKLGVLKMDVDDLGRIFAQGLPDPLRGIARIAALSRTMKWFFEGYVNSLLQHQGFSWTAAGEPGSGETPFLQQLYPVFSGGDDFLLVGAWDAVFEFARRVRAEFRAFVGGHPGITLSTALLVLDPKTSISRFAAQVGERLDEAKGASAAKDRVGVFGEVLTWNEFDEAARLKHDLEVLVKLKGESRALVQRVQQSATGYGRLQEAAVHGHFRPEKIWRLAYFLARNAKKENLAEIRALAEYHERLLLDAFINPGQARNPALFVVAGRWAELATRDLKAAAEARRTPSSP